MRLLAGSVVFSATDLSNHLACHHLTTLERRALSGGPSRPVRHDPALERLIQRGLEHERAYVERLRAEGKHVVELGEVAGDSALQRTRTAMGEGADVIVQAALAHDRWGGRADLLLRVPDDAGGWLYEVADTKLARETRAGTILQLCVYADLLHHVQGRPAPRMHVVKPAGGEFEVESFALVEFEAYYQTVRRRLEAIDDARKASETYPEPVEHCDVCSWWPLCNERRRTDDHLSFVADMSCQNAAEFRRQGIETLTALAHAEPALPEPPLRGSITTYDRLANQARVQLEGRRAEAPRHEILEVVEGRGLNRLPEPTDGDVYLDFEGNPFVGTSGLEYLLGYVLADEPEEYRGLWGVTAAEEKRAFEEFLDHVLERLDRCPDLHVYHFHSYEPAALKRLASRHATRERELDRLLRGERFVDLHSITRQSVRASVESYSLKSLEPHYGYHREVDLRESASPALRRVDAALEMGLAEEILEEDRAAVEGYNRDDCRSLIHLQRWLEGLRSERLAAGDAITRPPVKACSESEDQEERAEGIEALFRDLAGDLDADREGWTPEQSSRWLLANMLEYFHRERRVDWWEYFARRDAEDAELRKDRKAIVGLELVREVDTTPRGIPIHRYRYPDQEVGLSERDDVQDIGAEWVDGKPPPHVGTIAAVDPVQGTVDIKKTGRTRDEHPAVIHDSGKVPLRPLPGALQDFARWVADHGVLSESPEHRAARDLLLRLPPRRRDAAAPLRGPGEDLLDAQLRAALDLDGGVLAVQGPPGTGKSYTGARVIRDLVRAGKRVGVCATSHKVVRSLLEKVIEASAEDGEERVEATHKISSRSTLDPDCPDGLEESQEGAAGALDAWDERRVLGGVSWLWAHPNAEGRLDYLFIDEAGQLSLAYVLAVARSAKNLVLLGDPQQLQQPQRGAHPEGADVSALAHLLDGRATIPGDRGLFLDQTWRLHAQICEYTSDLFYDSLLGAHPNTARQRLEGATEFAESGLYFVPVDHEGNQSSSEEEVAVVGEIVESLVAGTLRWVDFAGHSAALTMDDVLVIAPYNLQVAALKRRLPSGVAVGTVDRFQGQEAAVTVYSLTSSSPEDAPRGMAFLYDLHRLNVATSRGRCVSIVVGSPRLLEPECRSPQHMRLANGLARFARDARWTRSSGRAGQS